MLDLTKLLVGTESFGSSLRYTAASKNSFFGVKQNHGPVVAWTSTQTCNLSCVHCYAKSTAQIYENELSTEEAKTFIQSVADFKSPVLLFTGGEPLLRKDFLELATFARECGVRPTISTNGTLITPELAQAIKNIGVGYVGISIDGLENTNDTFRKTKDAFKKALAGIRNCVAVGQKVGLRFTITKHNYKELPDIFRLLEDENINRICFYHLVYSGRGKDIMKDDISHQEMRDVMDLIIEKVFYFHKKGLTKEILTVDNHADGVYLYLWLKKNRPDDAEKIYAMLKNNGGNRSGMAFANIGSTGEVYIDQFTRHYPLGNIRDKSFPEIWTDPDNELLNNLRNRQNKIEGRCHSCKYYELCNGNFRARAEAVRGNFWDSDPACYLTDQEIGV